MPKEKSKKEGKNSVDWQGTWNTTKDLAKKTKIATGSILNGTIGNHLENWKLPLSREMGFYQDGSFVDIQELVDTILNGKFNKKLCILIHGLVSDETMWKFPDSLDDYGKLLQSEFGIIPAYVRYNSGRHISDNGQDLNLLLSALHSLCGKQIHEIQLITHSMGGLVTRSACYYGQKTKSKWVRSVTKIVFIGSPHHGAPLEKFGNYVTSILGAIPNPFTHLTKKAINLRSAGIKDLRYGLLVEEDWKDKDPDAFSNSEKTIVPLVPSIQYYVITGTLHQNSGHFLSEFFGDAIVGKGSALGKSGNSKYDLNFPKENIAEIPGLTHIKLMHHQEVYSQIRVWFSKK
ncbi:MAG: hypothetical protein O9301_07650 [Leptospira sp.]|nr:hypothetical protein [Leptospira sp.]